MKRFALLIFPISTVLMSSSDGFAGRRNYVWTYEYQTTGRGETELETFLTLSAPDIDSLENNTFVEHQIELEIGMNDRFDVGIYQLFEQAPGQSLTYSGFKLEGRYRIGEKGRHIVDPLLYLEYKGKPDFSEHEVEFKLILARDFGPGNISLNPIVEFVNGDESEVEAGYAAGIGRKFGRLMKFGIEAKGSESGNYIGPVFSHGTEHAWATLGAAFGVGDIKEGKPEFQIRLLMGFEL